jgi:hypothetical protein
MSDHVFEIIPICLVTCHYDSYNASKNLLIEHNVSVVEMDEHQNKSSAETYIYNIVQRTHTEEYGPVAILGSIFTIMERKEVWFPSYRYNILGRIFIKHSELIKLKSPVENIREGIARELDCKFINIRELFRTINMCTRDYTKRKIEMLSSNIRKRSLVDIEYKGRNVRKRYTYLPSFQCTTQ